MKTRREVLENQLSQVKESIKRYKDDLKDFKDGPGERVLFFTAVNGQINTLKNRKQELRAELKNLPDEEPPSLSISGF
ncbi:hypothetical protein BN59_01041 [Legionella massiliensis]|uniref:Uncharacterized protein n=1 Tax=Legionella massiliensis TaxID=1034943 RepID=A0A078KUP3_9GAMM|nr:hypothetical protein [Legionella massiliensis]CDZ76766.1 hypothetical protein BN59_01041 [Legionella massiliensis]CEE12504.1 hypothetical protein BN1094_01041 [Legionella massiliensis]